MSERPADQNAPALTAMTNTLDHHRRITAPMAEDLRVYILTLREGSDEVDEPAGFEVTISASGEAIAAASAQTASPLQDWAEGCIYDWRSPPQGVRAWPCHLWMHIGKPLRAHVRAACGPSAVVLDISQLHWVAPTANLTLAHARLARDLMAIHVVHGHVCVDFEDTARILRKSVTVLQIERPDPTALLQGLADLLQTAEVSRVRAALVVVSFPLAGGKLAYSKQAMTHVRNAAPAHAQLTYATTIDAELPAGSMRVIVVGDFVALDAPELGG